MWLALLPERAHAYTISTAITDGCHERITTQALRTVRSELSTAAPLPADENERALIDDLQFTAAGDMHDLGGTTLLLGVRDNDLKGRSSKDLTELAEVHGDPDAQQEHCLRAGDQDEPGGSAAAVSSCRSFIRERVLQALAGLDASGKPDPEKRTPLSVYLELRHHVDAPLPTYYVRIGQALHAIQDSFTHTYRSTDETQITVVLNYFDQVGGSRLESRDGPGHASELDRCDDPDDLRNTRRVLATEASTEILRATHDPQMTKDEKMAAVEGVLDSYLGYSPGCTFADDWCDAPERQYADAACACTAVGKRRGVGALWPAMALLGLGIARRKRRSKTRPPTVGGALALSIALALGAGSAHAQSEASRSPDSPNAAGDEPTTTTVQTPARPRTATTPSKPQTTTTTTTTPGETPSTPDTIATKTVTPETTTVTVTSPTEPDASKPPPPTLVPVAEPGPRNVSASAWGAFLGASGAVDNAALAGTLGLRLRANSHWIFGLDAEWNPWIGHGAAIKPGVANLYATAMLQLPLAYENFNLRSSLSLGGSRLLMSLYGAPKGSTGLFVDVSFLGVAWKMSRAFYLITNPLNLAIPIPQLQGVPLTYPQYRLTIGLEAYLG